MAISTDEVISTLNNLIETSKDGEMGFRTCAEGVKQTELKTLFSRYADSCAEAARELQNKVRNLGGDPEKSGSVSGAAHRAFVNIKSAITGVDEAAIVAEAERGEDVAMSAYQAALRLDLPTEVRSMIERQYAGVREHHDRIRDLKHQNQKRKA